MSGNIPDGHNIFFWVGMSHFQNFEVCDVQNFCRFARMLEQHMLALEDAFERRVDASPQLLAFEEAQTDQEYEAFFLEIVGMFSLSGPKDWMPDAQKKAIVVAFKMYHYLKEAQRGGYVTIVKGFSANWFGWSCIITGLVNAPQHNGMRCVIQEFDAVAGRWKVVLQSGQVLAVKEQNLTQVWDMPQD
jgi:hypothetical protein